MHTGMASFHRMRESGTSLEKRYVASGTIIRTCNVALYTLNVTTQQPSNFPKTDI